jgi:hypothetical protein
MEAISCPTPGRGGQTSWPLVWVNLAFRGDTPKTWRKIGIPVPLEAHTYFLDTTSSCVGKGEDMLF